MKKMTADEYRLLRITSGLTQSEACVFHDLKDLRTIQRWEKGDSSVPDAAAQKMLWLNGIIQNSINNAVGVFTKKSLKTSKIPESVILISYSDDDFPKFLKDFVKIGIPNSAHKAIIAMTYAALKSHGADVFILQMDAEDYHSFLRKKKMADSQEARSAWAGSKNLNQKS